MKKRNLTQELVIIFWLFIFGSILGYIFEMIVALVQKGHFESRQGLIYGPFTPVYGIGAIIYYLILNNIKKDNKIKIFFITAKLLCENNKSEITNKIDEEIEEINNYVELILFLIPGTPKDLLVYVAGLLPIKPIKFILISTFARFPSVITSTLAGDRLAIGDWKMSIILYVAILILVAIVVLIINKFDKDKITKDAINSIK